jgi:hypothetical protein
MKWEGTTRKLLPQKGGRMELFWTIVVFAFVAGTLFTVMFAVTRMFGGAHWRSQH